MPTPGQPAQSLHDCSPQAWRPRAGGFLGLYVSRWACGPAGFGDSFLSFHFLAFGTAPWALRAQHPSDAWRRGVHPRGQAWECGRWGSLPRRVTPAVVPWQRAVDNQSPRPRGGLCDRGVPTLAAAWVVPRTPGGLISVAAESFRSVSQLCPPGPLHPFPKVACGLMPGARRPGGPPSKAWPMRPKPVRS